MLIYIDANKIIPPNLLSQPIIASCTVFSTILAPNLTTIITPMITIEKERKGIQYAGKLVAELSQLATTDENFIAAAKPIMMAAKEKTATIKPFE